MRNRKKNVSDSSDEESSSEDDSADSDATVVNQAQKKTPAQKKLGRPPARAKRKAVQSDSESDTSPQPGPSHVANGQTSQDSDNYESESESESEDSDYGPLREKIKKKQQPSKRKGRPQRGANAKKRKNSNSANNVSHHNNSGNRNQVHKISGNQNQVHKISGNQSQLLKNSVNHGQHKPNTAKRKTSSEVTFDAKQVESLAQKLVYFFLIEDQKKYAIRRKAVTAHVFKDETYSSKLYNAVMKKANFILQETYGMEVLEIEKQKDSYLIINVLKRELGVNDFIEIPRLKQQQQGLIIYLLTLIFMNDNVITEEELTKSLKQLGIDLTAKKLHPVFGDVKKYITTELVKQMYLNYECISREPPKYEFTWGLRAVQEFDKKDALQFACQIMDDTTPEDWRIQFKDAENPQTNGST